MELAPFAGVQFPGYVDSTSNGRPVSIGIGLDYGATMDIAFRPGWRFELLYSRQATELSSRGDGARYGLKVERYLVGIQEEKGDPRTRFFGVFLAGVTRFAPGLGGYDSDVHFTLGLSLGVKRSLSERFGLRAEARGFFVNVNSGGGVICSGSCLFVFRGSGLWQGDLSAGVTILRVLIGFASGTLELDAERGGRAGAHLDLSNFGAEPGPDNFDLMASGRNTQACEVASRAPELAVDPDRRVVGQHVQPQLRLRSLHTRVAAIGVLLVRLAPVTRVGRGAHVAVIVGSGVTPDVGGSAP